MIFNFITLWVLSWHCQLWVQLELQTISPLLQLNVLTHLRFKTVSSINFLNCGKMQLWKNMRNSSLLIEWEAIWRILQSHKAPLKGISHWYLHVHFCTKVRVMACLILFHLCQGLNNCFIINEFVPNNFLESLLKLDLCNSKTQYFWVLLLLLKSIILTQKSGQTNLCFLSLVQGVLV